MIHILEIVYNANYIFHDMYHIIFYYYYFIFFFRCGNTVLEGAKSWQNNMKQKFTITSNLVKYW